MDNRFDNISEEELQQAFDEFIDEIKDEIITDELKTTILNPTRFQQFQFCYAVCKFLTRYNDDKVSYKLFKPFKSMASVTIEGKNIEFFKPEWFARAAEFADNTEAYPLANGNIRITFTFHNITVPIE